MKTLALFSLSILLTISSAFALSHPDSKPKKETIIVRSDKNDVFSFKADKKFLGATIEVYNSSNILTGKEMVFDRKMIIDFFYMPTDTYRIKIKMDNEVLEFQFIKK